MPRDFARKFFGTRAIVFDLRRTAECIKQLRHRDFDEAEVFEKWPRSGAEEIERLRTAGMRGLARRVNQRSSDTAFAHRVDYVERSNQSRVEHRLDADDADQLHPKIRNDVACGRPFEAVGDHSRIDEHRTHWREVAGLLDDERARLFLSERDCKLLRGYFFGGGNSCSP